jgi:hypothetical protein
MKKLKAWNGRPYEVLPTSQWKGAHIYVAAYSVEDVRRLCGELGLSIPSRNEINEYWSKGCWGNAMEGVVAERGVWVGDEYGRSTPKRVTPPSTPTERKKTPQ